MICFNRKCTEHRWRNFSIQFVTVNMIWLISYSIWISCPIWLDNLTNQLVLIYASTNSHAILFYKYHEHQPSGSWTSYMWTSMHLRRGWRDKIANMNKLSHRYIISQLQMTWGSAIDSYLLFEYFKNCKHSLSKILKIRLCVFSLCCIYTAKPYSDLYTHSSI